MKRTVWLSIVVLVFIAVLINIESEPSLVSVAQTTILNRYHKDLFQFILHPDTVEMWFLWISHFRSADKKPLTVGKQYQAVYNIPFVGDQILLFQVKKCVPDMYLSMESESLFKPKVEVETSPVNRGEQTRLTFRISFRRSSLLFQV